MPVTLLSSMMASAIDDLNTAYVYDLALKLRNNFDMLIQAHGADPYEGMVPLIVRTLEQLECVMKQHDVAKEEIEDLKYTIERLQNDKKTKAIEREKYQKELEAIEESWQNDARTQRDLISRLQADNNRLNDVIKNKLGDIENIDKAACRQSELETEIESYKEKLQRQREELRLVEREVTTRVEQIDELQSQLERSRRQNSEFKRKSSFSQGQVQNLIEEKSDLQAQLHDKDLQIQRLKDKLRRSNSSSGEDDQNALKPLTDDEFSKLVARLSVDNKMIIDLNDADQPRFTLADVSDIMNERNKLKQEVISLEEELSQYKPDFAKLEEGALVFEEEEEIDPPVQGPINKEPDEKVNPEKYRIKGSGIRKFFDRLFSPNPTKRHSINVLPRGVATPPSSIPRVGTTPSSLPRGVTTPSSSSSRSSVTSQTSQGIPSPASLFRGVTSSPLLRGLDSSPSLGASATPPPLSSSPSSCDSNRSVLTRSSSDMSPLSGQSSSQKS